MHDQRLIDAAEKKIVEFSTDQQLHISRSKRGGPSVSARAKIPQQVPGSPVAPE